MGGNKSLQKCSLTQRFPLHPSSKDGPPQVKETTVLRDVRTVTVSTATQELSSESSYSGPENECLLGKKPEAAQPLWWPMFTGRNYYIWVEYSTDTRGSTATLVTYVYWQELL